MPGPERATDRERRTPSRAARTPSPEPRRRRRATPLVGAALLTLAACLPGTTPSVAPAAGWQRDVAPFEVLDRDGRPYDHPFLGGFVVPRPQLIDIDGDGDLDLFIQERSNELMFFENVGTPGEPRFVWRTDRFHDLDIHEWYRFVDMEMDGTYDLIAEQPFSLIRYYRNDGTPTEPRFVLAADTLRLEDGRPLYSDRQNIANAIDLDANGRVDLFVGHVDGTVSRYQAIEPGTAVPRFRLLDRRFGDIEIVTILVEAPTLHGANTMDFADVTGNGVPDLLWGDFFEPGLLLLENTGTRERPEIQNFPVPFPPGDPIRTTGYNAPAVGDLTGNGLPDMLIGVLGGAYNPIRSAVDNLLFLAQTGNGWELRTRRFIYQIDVGSESVPTFGDVTGNGAPDLLIGGKIEPDDTRTGGIHLFENIGAPDRPRFREAGRLPIAGSYHYSPALADLDGDGLLDLVVGTWNDGVLFYRNEGTATAPRWEPAAEPLVRLTRGSHSTPALGDLTGNGALDLVVGKSSGRLSFYRNDGTPTAPRFVLVSDEWHGIDVGRRSHPALVDLDGDGRLDLVVGNEAGALRVFRNVGSATEPRFQADPRTVMPAFPVAAPAFADLTGDGVTELVMGGLSGGVVYYRRARPGR